MTKPVKRYTIGEIAAAAGVPRAEVSQAIRTGAIERMSSRVLLLFDEQDVAKWIARKRRERHRDK